jgi:hypothetical protein
MKYRSYVEMYITKYVVFFLTGRYKLYFEKQGFNENKLNFEHFTFL